MAIARQHQVARQLLDRILPTQPNTYHRIQEEEAWCSFREALSRRSPRVDEDNPHFGIDGPLHSGCPDVYCIHLRQIALANSDQRDAAIGNHLSRTARLQHGCSPRHLLHLAVRRSNAFQLLWQVRIGDGRYCTHAQRARHDWHFRVLGKSALDTFSFSKRLSVNRSGTSSDGISRKLCWACSPHWPSSVSS